MEKKLLPISVLIPTMNRTESLRNTVLSYLSCEYIPSQIVIIDQSTKETDRVKNQRFIHSLSTICEIQWVYQEVPSLTAARNTAFSFAKNEIIVFSDDDIEVEKVTLQRVFSLMKRSEIAMIAGINLNSIGVKSKTRYYMGYLLGTKSFRHRKGGYVTLSMLGRYPVAIKGEIPTQWAMGYFFVVRKSLVSHWGLKWDENLTSYAYAEDLDFSYSYYKKAKTEHLKCVLNDRVKVKHLASKEYRIPSRKSTFMYVLNRAYLSKKHKMGWRSCFMMNWCNFWIFMERVIQHQNPRDMFDACVYLRKHRKEVLRGNLWDGGTIKKVQS